MKEMFPLPAIVRPAEDLEARAARIKQHLQASEAAAADSGDRARSSLEEAWRAGKELNAAKEEVPRGQWGKWLKAHVPCSEREAQRYMAIATHFRHVSDFRNLTLRDALRQAADLQEEGESNPLPKFFTLEDWNAADDALKCQALNPPESGDRFNAQGDNENIKWALWSWNPVTGCNHNCPYCYARDIADRFYEQKFAPSFWPGRLNAPANTSFPEAKAAEWMGHKNVFVCSMADLFGRWVPREWIEAVLRSVRAAPQWNFLFLTKFPIRMAEFDFPENTWVGTTVDCQARVANAEKAFRKVKAGIKWLSCEPLIEPLKFKDLGAFDWIVLGGASKSSQTPEWRPPHAWTRAIEEEAERLGVIVYEKTNLWPAREGYPGSPYVEPSEAPEALRYLPGEKE